MQAERSAGRTVRAWTVALSVFLVSCGSDAVGTDFTSVDQQTREEACTMDPSPCRVITECGPVRENVCLGADLQANEAGDSFLSGSSESSNKGACLTLKQPGVTVDGRGHRIRAAEGEEAIRVTEAGCVTIRDVVTEDRVIVYGEAADYVTIAESTLGFVGVYRADDFVLRDNQLSSADSGVVVAGQGDDPAQRSTIEGNEIVSERGTIILVSTGSDGEDPCVRGDHKVLHNTVTGTSETDRRQQRMFFYRCGSHSRIASNRFRSRGHSLGMQFRDLADHNMIEDNDVVVGEHETAALFFLQGNSDKESARFNVIRNNEFRALRGRSIFIETTTARENRFEGNVFWSNRDVGVRIYDASNNVFDRNTFYDDGNAKYLIVFRALGSGSTQFTNNIFSYGNPDGAVAFAFDKPRDITGYNGDHNVFWNRTGPVRFHPREAWDLDEWRDQGTGDLHSIVGDPVFCDPSAGDFRLRADSAAIGAGVDGTDAGAFPFVAGESCS